jgi:hypothetical protein
MKEQTETIWNKTKRKRPYARYTLVVEFRPEFYSVDKETGSVLTGWTYRSDNENAKYAADHNGTSFKKESDVLGYIINTKGNRFLKAKLYCNYDNGGKPLRAEWQGGNLFFPYLKDIEERKKVMEWLYRIKHL